MKIHDESPMPTDHRTATALERIAAAIETLASDKSEVKAAEVAAEHNESIVNELRQRITGLQTQNDWVRTNNRELTDKIYQMTDQIALASAAMAPEVALEEITRLEKLTASAYAQLEEKNTHITQLEDYVNQLESKVNQQQATISRQGRKIRSLRPNDRGAEIDSLLSQLGRTTSLAANHWATVKKQMQELADKDTEIEHLKAKVQELTNTIAATAVVVNKTNANLQSYFDRVEEAEKNQVKFEGDPNAL